MLSQGVDKQWGPYGLWGEWFVGFGTQTVIQKKILKAFKWPHTTKSSNYQKYKKKVDFRLANIGNEHRQNLSFSGGYRR